MIDEMKENEQQADSVAVDVQTGERSDEQQAPTFEIVEHTDGRRYIRADQLHDYKAHRDNEYKTIQSELDNILSEIDAIDGINNVEERQAEMQKLIDQFGEDYDMTAVTDFENEAEFNEMMAYITATYQSSFGNPSAGFGAAKAAEPANSYKNQYERGVAAAREIYEKRGR